MVQVNSEDIHPKVIKAVRLTIIEEKKSQRDEFRVIFRKTEGKREKLRGELRSGWEEIEWDDKWRKSGGRLFHKAGAARWKDLFVIFRR
jgi:hypothetical protein